MNIKKKALAMAIAGAFTIGVGTYIPVVSSMVTHQVEASATTAKEKNMQNPELITDTTNSVLSKNDILSITDEQTKIHKNGDVAVKYVFYTYIYDSDTKAKDKAKEVAENYFVRGEFVPFIFVLNKNGDYHFVEDTKLAPYTSSAYLSTMAENLFANGVSADKVKEFLVRADSTIEMSVDGDFAFTGQMPINEKATAEHVEIQNFNDKQNVGKHSDKEQNDIANTTSEESQPQEDGGFLPGLIAFILAGGTIAFFMKKRKEKK